MLEGIEHRQVEPEAGAEGTREPVPAKETGGHLLYGTGKMIWCHCCGAYSSKFARKLKLECPGPVGITSWKLTERNRLRENKHPKTAQVMEGTVRRLNWDELGNFGKEEGDFGSKQAKVAIARQRGFASEYCHEQPSPAPPAVRAGDAVRATGTA